MFQNLVNEDRNVKGSLLGRQVELVLEDSATSDSVAEAKAAKLVERDKVVHGGIYSSTAIKRAAVERAGKLYVYRTTPTEPGCPPKRYRSISEAIYAWGSLPSTF